MEDQEKIKELEELEVQNIFVEEENINEEDVVIENAEEVDDENE